MRRLALLLPLAACAGLATPLPQSARLSSDRLTVTLTDSETCTGAKAEGTPTATGWSGHLTGCSQALPYEVRFDRHPNLLQGALTEVFGVIGAHGLLSPGGEVLVTDAKGTTHVFASPPTIPERP